MVRWEYLYLYISDETRSGRDQELAALNAAGAEGWEFTGHTSDTGFGMDFLMKRKLPVQSMLGVPPSPIRQ